MLDPVKLSQELLRCQSVTPNNDGAIELVALWLKDLGFTCEILEFSGDGSFPVKNLYARYGTSPQNFCFAGHTDVVPVGDENAWQYPPFGGEIADGYLYGRGAVDMKVAICCFIVAAQRVIAQGLNDMSLSLIITGDEEADGINGTAKVLRWLEDRGEKLSLCLIGEPTCRKQFGDTIKIGRRGSINFEILLHGKQGHVAYKENFANPISTLVTILHDLKHNKIDDGNENFEASNLEVTNIEVNNPATNVVPAKAMARLNIRFNNLQSAESLEKLIRSVCDKHSQSYKIKVSYSGEAYTSGRADKFIDAINIAVKEVTGITPIINTSGGITDGRFIKNFCPVMEFGMLETTAHQVDERVSTDEIHKLTLIYEKIISNSGAVIKA
jgi:succinyl-diaminopimelate desuccinylase